MMSHNSDRVNPDPQISPAHIKDGKEVSKEDPCELCGRPQWCFRSADRNLLLCARTDAPPSGWKRIGTASDGRPMFVREENSQYTQQNWSYTSKSTRNYQSQQRVSPLPNIPSNLVHLTPQAKGDFPIWTDVGKPVDGAVERQIIFSYPDPSTGKPLGRVVRRQWSDRRPVYKNNRTKSIYPEHWVESSNPKEGKWFTGKGKQPWSLYREAEVQEAIARGEKVIFYVAGEQAVESLRRLGLTAFCNQGGEGTALDDIKNFLETHKPPLLVIWSDHDEQGERTKVKLLKVSEDSGVLAIAIDPLQIWSEMPPKGDVTDILEMSGMKEPEIIRRLEAEIHRALSQRHQETAVLEPERQKLPAPAAIALELANRYRQQLAFDGYASRFLQYEAKSPGVWSEMRDVAVRAIIQAELDSRPNIRGKYGISYVRSIFELMQGYRLADNWNDLKDLLPFRNGVLNLGTGEFSPHAPNHHLTWTLPRDYDPQAENWNRISEWMDEALEGNATLKFILLCWLNACMRGRSDLQRCLHLIGGGGSGKGTFTRLCIALVGDQNVYSSTLKDWCENRFETSNACGKRLIVFSDQDKYRGGLGPFKSLTGGDSLRGEIKQKQAFQFVYTGMVMLSSNFPIFGGDSSSGMARRTLVVPFNRSVAPSKRRNLDAEFESELPALTNYVLLIPDQVVTQTLLQTTDSSSEVLKQTWENRIQENSIAAWLNESVILDPDAESRIGNDKNNGKTLFGSYWQYCDNIGVRPLPGSQFTPALLDLCQNVLKLPVSKGRNKQFHYFAGLRLRTSNDVHIPVWQEWVVLHSDGQEDGDGAVMGEGDGANSLLSLDCAGGDEETLSSDDDELEPNSASSSPFDQLSINSILPITPDTSIQGKCSKGDGSGRVMGSSPNTRPNSELKAIEVGSLVRKRYKQGWRGEVQSIQGEWVDVLWHMEKYPERISLAELEPIQ